jgi:hypothetical protein
MDNTEKGTGGAAVSVIAYKGEYVAAQDERKVIHTPRALKKCRTPESWGGTSAVR